MGWFSWFTGRDKDKPTTQSLSDLMRDFKPPENHPLPMELPPEPARPWNDKSPGPQWWQWWQRDTSNRNDNY